MSTYEILTIILTVFSGLVAVSAILVPVILNYLTKRSENKKKRPKEQDKLQFNEYRLKYMNNALYNYNSYSYACQEKTYQVTIKNFVNIKSEVFDKTKLFTAFDKYLEKMSKEDLRTYWYGDIWSKGHSELINDSN